MLKPQSQPPFTVPCHVSRTETPAARGVAQKFMCGALVGCGAVASALGMAAGSLVISGLMARGKPKPEHTAKKREAGKPAAPAYRKISNKLLVMRACAR